MGLMKRVILSWIIACLLSLVLPIIGYPPSDGLALTDGMLYYLGVYLLLTFIFPEKGEKK